MGAYCLFLKLKSIMSKENTSNTSNEIKKLLGIMYKDL